MDQLTAFFANPENALGIQAPYLKLAFKVTLVNEDRKTSLPLDILTLCKLFSYG